MWWFRRGRGWRGPWPGNGPWSHLPPWERPGWRFGRGYCWQLYYNPEIYQKEVQPVPASQSQDIYKSLMEIKAEVKNLKNKIEELEKQLKNYKDTTKHLYKAI